MSAYFIIHLPTVVVVVVGDEAVDTAVVINIAEVEDDTIVMEDSIEHHSACQLTDS